MEEKDFDLRNINKDIEDFLKGNDLDFCKLIVQSFQNDLSVTGKYVPVKSYYRLDDKLECVQLNADDNDDNYYYGVSPHFDSKKIIDCVSNLKIKTHADLIAFISANSEYFMIEDKKIEHPEGGHCNLKDYLKVLAEYIVVVMTSHFGIKIKIGKEKKYELWKLFENKENVLRTMFNYDDKDTDILKIYGCPTEKTINFLAKYDYNYLEEDNIFDCIGACEGQTTKDDNDKKIEKIKKMYEGRVGLLKGRVFYSGVLLKPTKLELPNPSYENDKIQSVCIHFTRSTYGTVCALDANLTGHPFLGKDKNQIIEMLRKDDEYKRQLNKDVGEILCKSEDSSDDKSNVSNNKKVGQNENAGQNEINWRLTGEICDKINAYLNKSFNVNQIGVSANIISSDGLMILGKRNTSSIDEGKLYPGVNGNAELADKNVSFYSDSVYEDYPAIRTKDERIDFFGEIGREAYAEIRQNLTRQEWICYGLIISGNMPKEEGSSQNSGDSSYTEKFRRMHFNLIFEHPCEKTFAEIEESCKIAAEAFETKNLIGINVVCETSWGWYHAKRFGRFLKGIVINKDFIEGVLTISVFLNVFNVFEINIFELNRDVIIRAFNVFQWNIDNFQEFVSIALAVLIVVQMLFQYCKNLYQFLIRTKKTKSFTIYKNSDYMSIGNKIEKKFRRKFLRKMVKLFCDKLAYLEEKAGQNFLGNFISKSKKKLESMLRKPYVFHPACYASLITYIENKAYDTFYPNDRR